MSSEPSPRIQDLIRRATAQLIADPGAMFASVDAAVLATQPTPILADAELTEAIRASNRSNLAHWAASNLSHPGVAVPPNRAEETVGLARVIARRGIEDTSRVAYGAGQNAAWTEWMAAVFAVTRDPLELQEILELSSRSVFAFVEAMLSLLREEVERERGQVLSAANARRLAVIRAMLEGQGSSSLMEELGYRADTFVQTATVLSEPGGSERLLGLVAAAAGTLGPRLRGRPLAVVADASTVWAWFPSGEEDLAATLTATFRRLSPPGAHVAVGPSRPGWDGFRAHADALAALEVANADVVSYAEVTLAALVRAEPARVRRFIAAWIADLSPELAETLIAYLAHRCSPSRTAAAIYAHRNTVIDRVRRAEAMLPVAIEGNELELALALALSRYEWPDRRGAPGR